MSQIPTDRRKRRPLPELSRFEWQCLKLLWNRGKAWVYRPCVSRSRMIRREIHRFLDAVFDGAAAPLVSHLADMEAVGLDDLRELEKRLGDTPPAQPAPGAGRPSRGKRKRQGS